MCRHETYLSSLNIIKIQKKNNAAPKPMNLGPIVKYQSVNLDNC